MRREYKLVPREVLVTIVQQPTLLIAMRDMCSQELSATHAADMRLLQEAKERERVLWEREIDAALAHVKVRQSTRVFNAKLRI